MIAGFNFINEFITTCNQYYRNKSHLLEIKTLYINSNDKYNKI